MTLQSDAFARSDLVGYLPSAGGGLSTRPMRGALWVGVADRLPGLVIASTAKTEMARKKTF